MEPTTATAAKNKCPECGSNTPEGTDLCHTCDGPGEPILLAIVERDTLKKVAMNLKKAIPNKTSLPVLSHTAVEADGKRLQLWGTDLDVTLTLDVPGAADVGTGFASCDVRKLKKTLTHMPDAPVHLWAEPGEGPAGQGTAPSLVVECGTIRTTFHGFPRDEFPNKPDTDGEPDELFRFPAETWSELSDRMAPFVSSEGARPILNGVLFERDESGLHVIATNGHRMMIWEPESVEGEKTQTILPGKAFLKPLRLILKRAGVESDAPARLDVYENHARLAFPGGFLTTRIIEGPYPNWRVVVPNNLDRTAIMPRADALSVVKTVLPSTSDQTHKVRVELAEGEPVYLSASPPNGPRVNAHIPGSEYDGEPLEIGFNCQYLRDVLKAHTADTLELEANSPEQAVMIQPTERDGWRTLLMPLRLLD